LHWLQEETSNAPDQRARTVRPVGSNGTLVCRARRSRGHGEKLLEWWYDHYKEGQELVPSWTDNRGCKRITVGDSEVCAVVEWSRVRMPSTSPKERGSTAKLHAGLAAGTTLQLRLGDRGGFRRCERRHLERPAPPDTGGQRCAGTTGSDKRQVFMRSVRASSTGDSTVSARSPEGRWSVIFDGPPRTTALRASS